MARKLRVESKGAVNHVMSRGDHCEAVFLDGEDRKCSLGRLLFAGQDARRSGAISETLLTMGTACATVRVLDGIFPLG